MQIRELSNDDEGVVDGEQSAPTPNQENGMVGLEQNDALNGDGGGIDLSNNNIVANGGGAAVIELDDGEMAHFEAMGREAPDGSTAALLHRTMEALYEASPEVEANNDGQLAYNLQCSPPTKKSL